MLTVPLFTGIIGAVTPASSGFHEPLTFAYLGAVPVIVGVILVTLTKEYEKPLKGQGDQYQAYDTYYRNATRHSPTVLKYAQYLGTKTSSLN